MMVWIYSWVSRADVVEGQIVGFEVTTNDEGGNRFKPKVVYEIDGETREFTSSWSANFTGFRVGETVKVFVSRNRKLTVIAAYMELYGVPIFSIVLFLFLRLGGFIYQYSDAIFYFLHPQLV
ncbi:hypothetical protein AM10699_00320 [Acaryochloris marina MBIC10699]|nr:hypothetical protein AM10699_00320 [Acaryochloris marina MBIC10699]